MPGQISEDTMAVLKQQLLDEQARLRSDRDSYQDSRTGDTEAGDAGELADYDPNDPADEATNLYDRDRDAATVENADRILAKIERALAKMDEGTYGLSDVDGTPIPLERLQALPYALATVEQEEQGY